LRLQHLAGAGERQGVAADLDATGGLVPGNQAAAVAGYLFLGECPIRDENDDRVDGFTPAVVGDAEDGNLRDAVQDRDYAFDLGGIDVSPPVMIMSLSRSTI
jgi:hypothetical protein